MITHIKVEEGFLFSLLPPLLSPLPSLAPSWSHLTDLYPEIAEFGGQVDPKENGMLLSKSHLVQVASGHLFEYFCTGFYYLPK